MSASKRTFKNEAALPRLPVPSLKSTTSKLLDALYPLVSQEDYQEVYNEASKFNSNEIIELVQSHLVAASAKLPCYLSAVNGETNPGIYGELRGDTLPRNPFLILEDDPYSKTLLPPNQTTRAANLINSSLKFISSLRNGTLKFDVTPKNDNPLTMDCYKNLFGTSRIPDEKGAGFSIKKSSHINGSRHIVVISNNQYYSLEVLTEISEKFPTSKMWFNDLELSSILHDIVEDSILNNDPIKLAKNSLGALTTETKTQWRLGRTELSRTNPENLSIIDDALFVVVLDPSEPLSDEDKVVSIHHGTSIIKKSIQVGSCTSRWYDKLQLVITKNSVAGIVWESSSMDSTAILRFVSDIYTDSILKIARQINGLEYSLFEDSSIGFVSIKSDINKPEKRKLVFNFTPELLHLIHLSETRLADLVSQHEYRTSNIKIDTHLISKFNVSRDSLIQVAFQIAYYALYGTLANTLEPITTRKFKNARTELIPVQNSEIAKLVKLFITDSTREQKWEKLVECCQIHTTQYNDAMKGKGFERHLHAIYKSFGRREYLNKLNPELEEIPDMSLLGEKIPLLSHSIISNIFVAEILISNCGNPALKLFGITPAIPQGFGIGYIIRDESVGIVASSQFRQTERLLTTFKWVVHEFKNLFIHQNEKHYLQISSDKSREEHEVHNTEHVSKIQRYKYSLPILANRDIKISRIDTYQQVEQHDSSSSDSDHNYILGGYGYFDVGEVEDRSNHLSKLNSNVNSKTASRSISRTTSSKNVKKINDLINLDEINRRFGLSINETKNRKNNIGRSLMIDDF